MSDTLLGLLCFALTLLFYYASKWLYGRKRILPLMPLLLAPTLLVAVVLLFHIPYQDYMAESHWLLWLLGPATVAFAVPVYENRQLIRRHWLSLSVGVVASVVMAVGSTVLLARWLAQSERGGYIIITKGQKVRFMFDGWPAIVFQVPPSARSRRRTPASPPSCAPRRPHSAP